MKDLFKKRANGTYSPTTIWLCISLSALLLSSFLGFNITFFFTLLVLGGASWGFYHFATRHLREDEADILAQAQAATNRQSLRHQSNNKNDTTLTTTELELFEALSQEFTDKEYDPPFKLTAKNIFKSLTFQKTE